jgi:hypothetical protein
VQAEVATVEAAESRLQSGAAVSQAPDLSLARRIQSRAGPTSADPAGLTSVCRADLAGAEAGPVGAEAGPEIIRDMDMVGVLQRWEPAWLMAHIITTAIPRTPTRDTMATAVTDHMQLPRHPIRTGTPPVTRETGGVLADAGR